MWDRLTQPLLDMGPPSLTPASALGGLSVLLLGVALAGLAGRRAQALADRHPSWPPERVALGLRVTRLAIVLGALLTAANLTGLSLDTLSFVWGLFNAPLLVVAGTEVSVVTILTVAAVVYGGFWFSGVAQKGVAAWAHKRETVDEGNVGTVQRLLHYTVVGITALIAMQTIGINLDAVLAAGAVFAVGFGLAMQGIAQNFVSGIILLVEQSIRPGDVVEVDGTLVRVEEMAVRSTVVVSLVGDRRIVPNSVLVQSTVRNLTLRSRRIRAHTRVGVAYHLDPAAVSAVLMEAAAGVVERIENEPPIVLFDNFGDSALEFDVYIWIEEPWRLPHARAALNNRIYAALKAHDMPIPFPQRTLHIAGS